MNIFTFIESVLGMAILYILFFFFNILNVIVSSNWDIFCIFQKPLSQLFKEVLSSTSPVPRGTIPVLFGVGKQASISPTKWYSVAKDKSVVIK